MTGFSIPEINSLVDGLRPEEPGPPEDDALPAADGPGRCRPGDLWQLGQHRLICGNAQERATVDARMGGERAQMVFTLEELGQRGILTKVSHRRDGTTRGGIPFTKGSLAYLVRNRLYLGEVVHNGGHFAGEHEPILSPSCSRRWPTSWQRGHGPSAKPARAAGPS